MQFISDRLFTLLWPSLPRLPTTPMELLLLTVYFLIVIYVLYQMALSLEDKLEDKIDISLDEGFLKEQTQQQLDCQRDASFISTDVREVNMGMGKKNIKRTFFFLKFKPQTKSISAEYQEALKAMGMSEEEMLSALETTISVSVIPTGRQTLRPIFYISIEINNDTENMQIYVNWDKSSLALSKQGNRIIRSTPNMPVDLSQPQMYSVVNPKQSFFTNVTIEKNYVRDPATNQVGMPQPVVDLKDEFEFIRMEQESEEGAPEYQLYGLDLMVGVKRITDRDEKLINLLLPFSFTLDILPGQIALPPLRWLMRRLGRRSRQQSNAPGRA